MPALILAPAAIIRLLRRTIADSMVPRKSALGRSAGPLIPD